MTKGTDATQKGASQFYFTVSYAIISCRWYSRFKVKGALHTAFWGGWFVGTPGTYLPINTQYGQKDFWKKISITVIANADPGGQKLDQFGELPFRRVIAPMRALLYSMYREIDPPGPGLLSYRTETYRPELICWLEIKTPLEKHRSAYIG